MKPLSIRMRAFAAYAGEQFIDFERLNESGLFLIHGPTGAGKTSVLDAISFALYGVCTGDLRQAKEMRSHHVIDDTPTEVTFDFSVGHKIYRAQRKIPQERKSSGKGPRTSAKLWELTRVNGELVEKKALGTKVMETNSMIEEILGFKADQFKQVVVLPQGGFRELLTANSSEREAVMQVLFRSELFKRIESVLKDLKKELETEAKAHMERLRILLERHRVDSLQDLISLRDRAVEEKSLMDKDYEDAKKRDESAREKLAAGKAVHDHFNELSIAKKELADLELKKEAQERMRQEYERAALADTLSHTEEAYKDQLKEVEAGRARLGSAQETFSAAGQELHESQRRLRDILAEKDRMEDMRERISLWKSLKSRAAQYEIRRKVLEEARENRKRTLSEAALAKEEYEKVAESLETCTREKALLERSASAHEYAKKAVAEMERISQGRRQLLKVYDEQQKLAGLIDEMRHELERLNESQIHERERFEELRAKWVAGQAGYLAQTLEQGSPCPVCGALEHPSPAQKAEDFPSEKDLKSCEQDARKVEEARTAAFEQVSQLERNLSELNGKWAALQESLGEWAETPLDQLDAEARTRYQALKDAKSSENKLIMVDQDISDLREALEKARNNSNSAQERVAKIEIEIGTHEESLKESENDLPEDLRSERILDEKIANESKKLDLMEKELRDSEEWNSKARERFSSAQAALKGEEEGMARAESVLRQKKENFEDGLKSAGFEGPEEYNSVKRARSRIKALEREIQEFDANLKFAIQRRDRAARVCKDLEEPQMESLETLAKEATQELETAIKRSAEVSEKLKSLEKDLETHEKISSDMALVEDRFQIMGGIADIANGANPERITFHRFVLSELLEEVAIAATQRLNMMSGGRYRLQRAASPSDKRTAGGLDFEVHDEYTGVARPARSLSGGETFLASLALALGLSDVTSEYTGGIRLDTIFIDEGFGGLDPEALDLAVKALYDLRAGGRIVGIISHVPELRERIPSRIEVKTTRRGSSASVIA